MTNFDAQYFIDKFEAIPEEMWCQRKDIDEQGRCCALGHCGRRIDHDTEESNALSTMLGTRASHINDNRHSDYKQATPKQRILAALRELKETGK